MRQRSGARDPAASPRTGEVAAFARGEPQLAGARWEHVRVPRRRPDEHLTDGWKPDTPDSDTWVRTAVGTHADWAVATAESKGRPWRRTDRWAGTWIGDLGELTNTVLPLRPADAEGFAGILDEVEQLVPPTAPFVMLSPFPTPDLTGHGLLRVGHPPLMVRPAGPGPDTAPDGVEVRRVADDSDLAVARRVLVEGYPLPDIEPLSQRDHVWLAYVDGEPVAVAAAYHAQAKTLVIYVAALSAAWPGSRRGGHLGRDPQPAGRPCSAGGERRRATGLRADGLRRGGAVDGVAPAGQ
jgi:hypothetical protein